MFLYPYVPPLRCSFLSISSYCFRKYETSSFILSKVVMSSFSFKTSSRKTSPFVSLILHSCSGGYYRNLPRYKDRSKCNSHFLKLDSLSPRSISFLNVLTDISCLLNCYLVEKMVSSLHYPLLSLFEFPDHDRCSFFVFSSSS